MRTVQRGEVIAGKYVVQGIIGRGGVGIIAAARHVTLKQLVALKFLRPEIASDPEVMQRFVREAQAVAQIRSEHVARVMDAGTLEDGTVFLVFEHLAGRDLARVLREDGPLPIVDAVDYVMQACEAIAEAHALGIVHRDLKPANLFLTRAPDGTAFVKVLDFGLSKLSQSAFSQSALTALTAENHVIGSPHFMSPEQMRSSRDADARSDIWALGVVLFGLLTGRVPFEGEFLTEVCAAILGGKPLSLLELRPEAPALLEAVILHCLRSKPEERIQSVAELAQALEPFSPALGRARAARIARVADGAKRTPERHSSAGSEPGAVDSAPLAPLSQAKGSLEKLVTAAKAAQHGPSPVSWSISVGKALSQRGLNDGGPPGLAEAETAEKERTPLAAMPSVVPAAAAQLARGARSRRRPVLVATAVLSLLLGTAGTLWLGRAQPRRPVVVRSTASVDGPTPMIGSLAVSVSALRASPVPQAAGAPSASSEPVARIIPASKSAKPVSDDTRTPAAGERRSTPVRSAPPRPAAARPAAPRAAAARPAAPHPTTPSKPARPALDEELILGLPH